MHLIFCLDEKNGILFNRRRQSRDSAVIRDALALSGGNLFVTPFSEKIMKTYGASHTVVSDPTALGKEDWLFYEEGDPSFLFPLCQSIIVYRWNEVYPSDVKVNLSSLEGGDEDKEFEGSSHKKITRHPYFPR